MDRRMWARVIAVDMLLLCYSLNISMIGQMFGSVTEFYGISLSTGGVLLSMQSVGGLLLAVLCILFVSGLNKVKLMTIGGVVLCGSLMLLGVLPPLIMLFILFVILGFSGGAVNTLCNPVMMEIVPSRPERYVNFMHMLFSLGAVMTPLVSQAIFPSVGLTGVFLILGGFALCWSGYAVFAFSGDMKTKLVIRPISLSGQFRKAVSIFKTPGMGVVFLISILITSWQLSVTYYISSYFTGLSGNAMDGALALSLMFLGMMVSRLAYSRVADMYAKGRVLLLTNIAGLLAWAAVLIVPGVTVKMVLLTIAAAACANNFPIVYTVACQLAPENAATAASFALLGYYIALFAFIPMIGALGDAVGLGSALAVCIAPLLLMIPASWALHRRITSRA